MTAEKINYNNSDETRIALLEQAIGGINNTLSRMESDLKESRKEFKFELSEDRKESRMFFKWTMGSILGIYAANIIMFVTFIVKFSH